MDDSPNAHEFCVEFEINQPRVAEIYYFKNPKIDEINHTRQDDFQLERKLQTKDWSINVDTSIPEWMMMITTIFAGIVIGGMTGTLNSSTTIFRGDY